MSVENTFSHLQSAHCENGVTTNLLRNCGMDFMTEPLAFGMGSGLFYIHIPFITFSNGPAISFRTLPGKIFKRSCKSLNIRIDSCKFSNEQKAQASLDNLLQKGYLVGCQVGVFQLPYFPVEYRFHFNAHNLLVYGKSDSGYLISDPVMETVTLLSSEELNKVRFAKGMLAPKGHLYYVKEYSNVDNVLIKKAIVRGVKKNVREMLHIPGNFAGVKGINYTANQVRKWRDKFGVRKAGQYLGQIIRMQEEIGTGGGGFRFIYAAFLEQSYDYFKIDELKYISENFTEAGDLWRNNAVNMAGVLRGRNTEQSDFNLIADMLNTISEKEKAAFKKLEKLKFEI